MRKSTLFIAAAVLLFSLACQREQDVNPEMLRSGALTAHAEELLGGTRTSFVGYGSDNFAWEDGDEIALHLSNGKYDVVPLHPDTDPKTAKFYCSTTSGIHRDYYAVYPAAAVDAANYGQSGGVLNVVLRSAYDISGALASDHAETPMVADNTVTTPTGDNCDLEFYHVGGLVRITLSGVASDTETIKVTFDKNVTGKFTVSNPGTDHPSISCSSAAGNNGREVTFTVSAVSPSTTIVLNVPVPCDEYGSVTVATYAAGASTPSNTQTRLFDDVPLTVARHHGKKLTLTDLSLTFSIGTPISDIAVSGTAVKEASSSDVEITVNQSDGTTTSSSPWVAYFSDTAPAVGDEISSSWSTTPLQDASGNDWLTLSAYEGDGNADAVMVSLAAAPWDSEPINHLIGDALTERNALIAGNGVTNLDLSTYNYLNKTTNNTCQTANCYIIQSYGTYLIPCVYGNAITNGSPFASAYTTTLNPKYSNTQTLKSFINAKGVGISSPYIPTDISDHGTLSARVIWQDVVKDLEMLTDEDVTYVSTNGTAANCPYIRVNFRKEKIVPGNIVIALYDETNHKILWSWHLWVTAHEFGTIQVKQYRFSNYSASTATPVNNFLNVNLGWTPSITYSGGSTAAREQHVIIVSTANGTVMDSFKVSQAAYTDPGNANSFYSGTFYQWGRKDPFLPGEDTNLNRPMTYGVDFPAGGTSDRRIAVMNGESGFDNQLKNMIMYPYKFLNNTYPYPNYINLWDVNFDHKASPIEDDEAVNKTVYDPCPRGFHVPRKNAFTLFATDGVGSASNGSQYRQSVGAYDNGWNFITGVGDNTIFIPAAGERYMVSSHITDMGTRGMYWTAHLRPPVDQAGTVYARFFFWEYTGTSDQFLVTNSGSTHVAFSIRPAVEVVN